MLERQVYPVFTFVKGFELGHPFDPDLVLLGNVNFFVTCRVFISFRVVAPNVLSTEIDAGLYRGWPDERDQRLNVNDSSKVRKTVSLQVSC